MFIDLAGYTELSASRDPEDVHRVLARFFEKVDRTIIDFGGTVDKHIGDSVMALFGAPVSHGNDPERAIRAALAVQALMPALSREAGLPLEVHIGLALGEVVASGLGSEAHNAYTVIGEAANMAARLMAKAERGETLVSEAIRAATESVAAFEDLEPAALKGLGESRIIHRLIGLRADRAAELPLIGRQNELAQVTSLLTAVKMSGHGAAIALRGQPGIGKSRLLREIRNRAEAMGFASLSALVFDFGTRSGEDAPAIIVSSLLGVAPDADESAKLAALQGAVLRHVISEQDVVFLRDLLGIPQTEDHSAVYAAMDAMARVRGMSAGIARLLTFYCQSKALLLSVEDVHWAKSSFLSLIGELSGAIENVPLLLVMTTRVEGDPFDADWRARFPAGLAATIDLRPLRNEEAAELASSVIQTVDDFTRECVKRAEGNPLFLEQLLRSRLTDREGKLPHSVQGVVLARLDSLGEQEKRILQTASVLGQRIAPADLSALLGVSSVDFRPLLQRQLLKPEGDAYLFAHALVRDGVYASLTRERRRELHLKAAGHYAGVDLVLHAEHLDRAEDARAPLAYLAAAEADAASYRLERANAMVSRGLELARDAKDVVALGLAAGRLRLAAGSGSSARQAFQRANESASEPMDLCMSLIGLASADRLLSRPDSATKSLDHAEEIAATLSSDRVTSEIHYLRGNLFFARGHGTACREAHEKALAAAKRADLPEWQARAYSGLGDAAYLEGRIATSIRQFETCVAIAEKHQLLRVISPNRSMLADGMVYMLESEKALFHIEEALNLSRRIGDRFSEMFALQSGSFIHYANWNLDMSEGLASASLDLARQLGARRYEMLILAELAEVRMDQNRPDEAGEMIAIAERIAKETGPAFCGPILCMSKALHAGKGEQGLDWLRHGEAMLADAPSAHNQIFFRVRAMEFAYENGLWQMAERYADELSDFTRSEPLPYVDLFVERARAIGALARNPQDLQAAETITRLHNTADEAGVRLPFGKDRIRERIGALIF